MTVETSTELANMTGAWDLDPMHTVISFAARHAMVAPCAVGSASSPAY